MGYMKKSKINSYLFILLTLILLSGCASKEVATKSETYQDTLINYLDSSAYDDAATYYTDYIVQHPDAQNTMAQVIYTYIEEAVDKYNHDEISESEFNRATSAMKATGLDLSVYIQRFQALCDSKAAYETGVEYLANDNISDAVDAFGQMIVEDTLYETIVPMLNEKAEEYVTQKNYLPATIIYRKLESVYFEDVTVKLADTYRLFGDYLAEKGSIDLAVTAYGLSYSCDQNLETFNKYSALYASRHLVGVGGYDIIALKEDGTAMAAGRSGLIETDPSIWKNLIGVGASWEAFFGLTTEQVVVSEGSLHYRTNTASWSDVLNMHVGYLDVGAVISTYGANGELTNNTGNVEKGYSEKYNVEEFGMIYVGGDCHVGLRWDGTVSMLKTENGEKHKSVTNDDISSWTDVTSLFVNLNQVVAVREDGTVYSAGSADLSGWTDIVKVTGSAGNFLLGLKKDGTVVSYSTENMWGADEVSGWTDIIDIATNTEGRQYTAGVRKDGTLVAVGNSYVAELIEFINTMSGAGVPEY